MSSFRRDVQFSASISEGQSLPTNAVLMNSHYHLIVKVYDDQERTPNLIADQPLYG